MDDAQRLAATSTFYQPACRIAAGLALRGIANAAIDLSDGLASDLLHILRASMVGARIDLEKLPLSHFFCQAVAAEDHEAVALGGGDDYELCFTLPPTSLAQCQGKFEASGTGITVIGCIEAEPGIRYYRHGHRTNLSFKGYTHFV